MNFMARVRGLLAGDGSRHLPVVITEPDLESALDHLQALPLSVRSPRPWERR